MKKDNDGNILLFSQPSTRTIVHLCKYLIPILIIALPMIFVIGVYFFGWQLVESMRTEFEFNNARGSLTIDYVKEYVGFILGIATLELSLIIGYLSVLKPFIEKPRLEMYTNRVISPSDKYGHSWFIRLMVRNRGVNTAKMCMTRLIALYVEEIENGKGRVRKTYRQLAKYDPMYLYWMRQKRKLKRTSGKETNLMIKKESDSEFVLNKKNLPFIVDEVPSSPKPVDIHGGGDFYFVDVLHIKQKGEKDKKLELSVYIPEEQELPELSQNYSKGNEPVLVEGKVYYLLIGVYGDNTHIDPTWFRLECDQVPGDESFRNNCPCKYDEAKKPKGIELAEKDY